MKIHNTIATITICVLSTLTLFDFVNPHKVGAESRTNVQGRNFDKTQQNFNQVEVGYFPRRVPPDRGNKCGCNQ
ncbi:hypothetical protein [Nostoc sp.]|uniref:hypothetical protein n=1 Tax=Nostoc sp. TaxID=1180 RepID=UPI002FF4F388